MSGVKSVLSVITAILALQSCGRVSEDDARRMDPHAAMSQYPRMQVHPSSVEGEWESACIVEFAENGTYQKFQYAMVNGTITKRISVYRDSRCEVNALWERVYSGEYQVDLDKLRQRFYNLKVVSHDFVQTSLLNLGETSADRYCKSDLPFESEKEINFSPITQCNEETEQVSKLDLRGNGGMGQELFVDQVKLTRRFN